MGGGCSRPRPGRFTPREGPGTHCRVGWMGPWVGLDGYGKSRLYRDSIPGLCIRWQVAVPTELSRPTFKYISVMYYSSVPVELYPLCD